MAARKQNYSFPPAANPQAGPVPNANHVEQAVPQGEGRSLPALTVRIFPVHSSEGKLKATANVNIAGAFAVQGFRIFDSKNGLFVKEPEQNYIKEGTELTRSVFFPITKEAREALYGQILHSYELTMEREMAHQANDYSNQPGSEYAPPGPEMYTPDDDLPFEFGQSM